MLFAALLYILFAFLAAGGLFWILLEHRNWKVAVLGAVVTLLAFFGLAFFVVSLVQGGLAGG